MKTTKPLVFDASRSDVIIHIANDDINFYPGQKEMCIEFRKNENIYCMQIHNASTVKVQEE
jgi:hypothetical protein